jgi:hypothetical protein
MESSFIPNSNPAIGQTSTPSSPRLKRQNECGRGLSAPTCCEFVLVRRSAFDVRRSTFSLQRRIQPRLSNAQRPTACPELVEWVGRWTFALFRRVKGAWWPSRSSKPLLIPHTRDQGRFDSYPLRRSKFDGRWVMFEVATTSNLQSNINLQTSTLKPPRKEVRQMSREQIRRLTSLSSCAG